jgi:hypothetical protein
LFASRKCAALSPVQPCIIPIRRRQLTPKTAFVLTTCTLFPQPYTGTAQNHHDDKVAARIDAP